MVYLCGGQCWVKCVIARFARRHLWGICAVFVVLSSRRSLSSAVQRRVLLNDFTIGRFK